MTPQRRAHLTRQLIRACADEEACGEQAAAKAIREALPGRRYGVDQLKKAAAPGSRECLPLDVLDVLEEYCGAPVISRELAERFARPAGGDLMSAGVGLVEEAADLPSAVLAALADDGDVSPAELARIRKERDQVRAFLDRVDAAIAGVERRHAAATVTPFRQQAE